mmetsp:Transcript_10458/g.19230  ORF Transcript_10458/g.19230 Transcript_10458/m.19230 type:complete len:1281 (+) Transcript_10458:282-4124(+)
MQRLNSNQHHTAKGEEKESNNWRRQHYNYNYSHNSGDEGRDHQHRRGGRRRRAVVADAALADSMEDGFGEFPPTQSSSSDAATATTTSEITTPQTTNKRRHREAPQSRIRFAEGTRLSPIRQSSQHQVLVLGGGSSSSDRRSHHRQYDNGATAAATPTSKAVNTPEGGGGGTNNLDFSMIATPGGKGARMVDDAGFVTPSEANTASSSSSVGRWTNGTPFTSILRGVVSSTPGINPRQILLNNTTTPSKNYKTPYTAARESLNQQQQQQQTPGSEKNVDLDERDGECTALSFARSAPLSGYLRKLGQNIPTFKRRFFVLKPSTHLYYFVSPNDVEPRGCIDLDTVRDDAYKEGGCGCEVREIGALPDGSFRFELLFDEEEDEDDNASTDTGSRASSQNSSSKRRNFQRQSVVLEARTEEMGREWMSKLKSERLSSARDEVEYLRTNLAEMTQISGRWETSACEEAMRADRAERQRNAAISEAKGWEGKFTDLNEAIRLLAKQNNAHEGRGSSSNAAASSSSEFLTETLAGLDVDGTYFGDVSRAFEKIRDDYNVVSERETEAAERMVQLERRAREAESRAARAESELANVWEDNRLMQNDLKKARREKKILVKEVRSWHASSAAEENASKQSRQSSQRHRRCDDDSSKQSTRNHRRCDDASSKQSIEQKQRPDQAYFHSTNSQGESSRGGTTATSSFVSMAPPPNPKRKPMNEEEKRLVIELEEHVMSGLRLSEQFLTLNGIDPLEMGDDLDDSVQASSVQASIHQATGSVQASKASLDKTPERQSPGVGFSPQKDLSHSQRARAPNEMTEHHSNMENPFGSLLDESEDKSDLAISPEVKSTFPDNAANEIDRNIDDEVNNTLSYTADSTQGSILLNDIYQYEEAVSNGRDNSVTRNLNDRFREQITPIEPSRQRVSTNNHQKAKPTLNTEKKSSDRIRPPSLDLASSASESSQSRVTNNSNIATSKLACPLKDVGETPLPKPSNSTMGEDGKVYHITFYSKKIGLQFQKVPNETAKSTGLLTEAMTADHGPNVETNQTAAELRRIASISQHSHARNRQDRKRATECLPIAPDDAVLVCGFAGFDSSTGNIRPRIGARLVAFDGMTVEVGQWTFESIRKSIQARGRPLTLSFRNDFLTHSQRAILTKAIEDVKPAPPLAAHSHHLRRGGNNALTSERYQEHHHGHHGHHHQNTINTASTTSSSISSQFSSQPPKGKYYSSFSEAGSSISSAVAPLMSNLLSNSRSGSGKQQGDFAPDYLRRTSDSLEKMRHHHDFQSGLL